MNLKKKIAEKEEARLEKKVKEMNAKSAEKTTAKKRGRKKKTATSENSSVVVSIMENAEKTVYSQSAKADCGKPQLSLVPTKILEAIARVREYGNRKYKSKDNWKTVEIERYRDAAFRHWAEYIDDPKSRDEESGLPHLWHAACNIAFLVSLED